MENCQIVPIDPEERFILRNFELQRDERIEIESLRSLFRVAAQSIPFTNKISSLPRFIAIAQFRLNNLQVHEKLFFENSGLYEREPMVIATLMAAQTVGAEEARSNGAILNLRQAFTEYLPEKAAFMREDVDFYIDIGLTSKLDNNRTSLFCAHLEALELIHTMRQNFTHLDREFWENQMEYSFPEWKAFADKGSYLGQHLQTQIADMVRQVNNAYPAP